MSSIYKHLAKVDLNVEKDHPALLPTEKTMLQQGPKLAGMKLAILGAFILALVSFILVGVLFKSLQSERKDRAALEAHYADFRDEADAIRGESSQYSAELKRVREQLKNYSSERNVLKRELGESQSRIAGLQKKIREVEKRNAAVQLESEALRQKLSRSESMSVAPPLTSAVPLEPIVPESISSEIVAEPSSEPESVGSADSWTRQEVAFKVMTVNRKFNFVVVNLGMKDDLKIGDKLLIENDGKPVGTVQVEKLYENFAAATIMDEVDNARIREGNAIRRS